MEITEALKEMFLKNTSSENINDGASVLIPLAATITPH